ncbi:MAG: resolvase, partial [Blastopirellula sp.]
MKIVACYLRVSTKDQHLSNQRTELERWLLGNNIDLENVRWYEDDGYSGDTLDRPAFLQLQEDIFNGEIDMVVVWKLDRLSRVIVQGMNLLHNWMSEKGIRFVSTTQLLDFSGAIGLMMANMLLAFGQIEQEARRERQAIGITRAKAEG